MQIKKSSIDDKQKVYENIKTQILGIGPIKKGSITKQWYTCKTPNCRCKRGKNFRHGPYYWLTWKENNKSKSILLSKELLSEIKVYKQNYKILKKIIKKMENISEQIMKDKIYAMRLKKHSA